MYQVRALPLNYIPSHNLCLASYLSDYKEECPLCCMYNFPVDHTNTAWVSLEALECAAHVLDEDLSSPM